MALPGRAKALFDLGLRSGRLPLDAALHVTGRSDTPLQLTVDRLQAGMRSAAGILFDDEELRRQGERGLDATRDRERAAGISGGASRRGRATDGEGDPERGA